MKTALENIIEIIEGAKRIRGLSFIELAILEEAKRGLKAKSFSKPEVTELLKRQAMRSYNASCLFNYNIKPINF